MPSETNEQQPPVPQQATTSRNAEIVHNRISELLDNATEVATEPKFQRSSANSANLDRSQSDEQPLDDSVQDELESPPVVDVDSIGEMNDDGNGETDSFVEAKPSAVNTDAEVNSAVDTSASSNEKLQSSEPSAQVRQPGEVIVTGGSREDEEPLSPSTVRMRGRQGGVLIEIDEGGDWTTILAMLEERLTTVEGFFSGGRTVLEVGPRGITVSELRRASDLLARHHMTLAVVRSTAEDTIEAALTIGLSSSNETPPEKLADKPHPPVISITQPTSPYFVHNGTLRSGQTLRKTESVVVVGDVNPGAKVISNGDVMIWGRLRGIAYAGEGGNPEALVAAIEFSPTQLRIGDLMAVAPEPQTQRFRFQFWKKDEERRPEVAHVADGRIVVEPWDDTKPGRPKFGRR